MSEPDASPPVAARHEVVRDLHGVRPVDGYHWLSDRSSPATTGYLAAGRAFYESSTGHLEPLRTELFREMRRRVLPTDESVSWRRGGYVYSTRTVEGRDYTQLLRCKADLTVDSAPIVLLDENELAGSSDYFATGLVEPSPDGRLVAYSVDLTGDEVYRLRFRDVEPGSDIGDELERSSYGRRCPADAGAFFLPVHDE